MKNLFVIAQYTRKPKNKNLTHKKGYFDDENNISYDEKVQIATKVRNSDLSMCQVILDMKNKKIVKNSFQSGKSYDELIKYYTENYEDYFSQTLKKLIPNVEAEPVPTVQTET